jgi:hypothetical protein
MERTQIDTPLLNTAEAAAYLRLKPSTLNSDRITRSIGIPFMRIGRRVVYNRDDLANFTKSLAATQCAR